jgi:hypothetical protein
MRRPRLCSTSSNKLHQRLVEVNDLVEPRPKLILLTAVPPLLRPHGNQLVSVVAISRYAHVWLLPSLDRLVASALFVQRYAKIV